jgi:hypothetical protein
VNPAERLEIIRRKFKPVAAPITKPTGLHCATTGAAPVTDTRPMLPRTSGRIIHGSWGPLNRNIAQRFDWLKEPDKQKPIQCAPKRTKKVSPLTRISQQLPMKLKKVLTGDFRSQRP